MTMPFKTSKIWQEEVNNEMTDGNVDDKREYFLRIV